MQISLCLAIFWFLYQLTRTLHSAVSVAHERLRSMAGETIERLGMVMSLSLEVPARVLPLVSGCLDMFGVYAGTIIQELVYSWSFPIFLVLNKHIFGNMMFWFMNGNSSKKLKSRISLKSKKKQSKKQINKHIQKRLKLKNPTKTKKTNGTQSMSGIQELQLWICSFDF